MSRQEFEFADGLRTYTLGGSDGELVDPGRALDLLERVVLPDSFRCSRLIRWYQDRFVTAAQLGSDTTIVADLLGRVQTGWIRMHARRRVEAPQGHMRAPLALELEHQAMVAVDKPTAINPTRPHLRRVQLGNLFYWPAQIALFPTPELDRSPWAALITAARHMTTKPGDTPLLAFHQDGGEPPQTSERRSRAMRAFIRDDRNSWVALQTEHGHIADTQRFLAYLASTKAWPTHVELSGANDKQTKAAVLAFQRAYNNAYDDSIFEDGVVGVQTLEAEFTVLKDDLTRWFELNEADFAQIYHLPASAYIACGSRFAGLPMYSIGTYSGTARMLDLLFIPPGEPLSPELQPPGVGVYVDDVIIEHLRFDDIQIPQTHLLVVRLIDRTGVPLAGVEYELRVGNDHRHGTTNGKGEIAEANLADGIPIVRLLDGRVVVFHDRYEDAVVKHDAPERPRSPFSPTEDEVTEKEPYENADERLYGMEAIGG